ncbi:uncharacterized protein TNCV_3182391 [Trichonephila clavipes]|uniref:Uncharacterized protein n=1 Tax=Trichonephila clavipes TaxID=2585209 RepID=A0A8X6SLS0_TRICX|nr:uncharacterized protein TNCV_3182391 [Trichonephila clavipes]
MTPKQYPEDELLGSIEANTGQDDHNLMLTILFTFTHLESGTIPVDSEDHMALTGTEIYSRAKELICRIWVVPPVHPWHFQRHPRSAKSFKGSRSCQIAFSRLSTGHQRCMNFESGKRSFRIYTKCDISSFSPQHILQCLGIPVRRLLLPLRCS